MQHISIRQIKFLAEICWALCSESYFFVWANQTFQFITQFKIFFLGLVCLKPRVCHLDKEIKAFIACSRDKRERWWAFCWNKSFMTGFQVKRLHLDRASSDVGARRPGLCCQRRITVSICGWHVGNLCTRRGLALVTWARSLGWELFLAVLDFPCGLSRGLGCSCRTGCSAGVWSSACSRTCPWAKWSPRC